MAVPIAKFDFDVARGHFAKNVTDALQTTDVDYCLSEAQKYPGSESDKRSALDQAFRDVIKSLVQTNTSYETFKTLVTCSIEAVNKDLCSASAPFLILSDIFDMVTIDRCEEIFALVDDRVNTWKSDSLHVAGKNYLLRMCNDLLRRLSKSQNTVFCGKIQLFLSRLFPLEEKSALNLMGHFNVENLTLFSSESSDTKTNLAEVKEEKMDVEEGEMDDFSSSIPIDYNLYKKFWSLQDFFRKPSQCYDKAPWRMFVSYSDEVLTAFSSAKLDNTKSSKKKLNIKHTYDSQSFFAKYLTSEKLLDLQLNDSNFRRYVLVQFLILFQYLTSQVKFKSASQVLTDEQSTWLKNTQDKVYQLIKETPPDGDHFSKTVEHILMREESWNIWKNEGCPNFERNKPADPPKTKPKARRRRVGDDLQSGGGKIIKMGNAELTKLWNVCPDNMEACKGEKRSFLPTMEDFFADAIEQSDPAAMVEAEYKVVNNQIFQWKALRLLARRSPRFFMQCHTNTPAVPVNQYLESMLDKIVKEMPQAASSEDVKTEVGEEESLKEAQDDDTLKENDDQGKDEPPEDIVTRDHMELIAEKLEQDWQKLATELNFTDEEITFYESESDSVLDQCVLMLSIWQERECDRATAGALKIALVEIGHPAIAHLAFGGTEDR